MRANIIIILFLTISFSTQAQLITNQTGTITQWVQNVLVGPNITVSNVTYTGSMQSIGTFTTGATSGNLGFPSGMVLSTGNITELPGSAGSPNGPNYTSTTTNGGSDPQLVSLISQSINDAAVLEFDFIPLSDTIKFRYVFGSEEYPNFVNTINDVFGFFLSGLNPNGGNYTNLNIALIPGTTTPVSINTINAGLNQSYYVNNIGGTFVTLNAFTTVLTAWARVMPCMTYHIKLAIGDAADRILDSGVFLEANSFTANPIILNQTFTTNIDTMAIEGCNDAIITFKIPYVKTTNTIINFFPTGTATNGVDYVSIPGFVTVPAGQDSVNLVISPILDNITEPIEYIDLLVSTSPCTSDTIRIYIKDNEIPICELPTDTIICSHDTITLIPNTIGGYAPYRYIWSTGDTTSSITISPSVSTMYHLTLTDQCNNDSIDSIMVYASNPLMSLHGDSICLGDTAHIWAIIDPTYTFVWNTGAQTTNLDSNVQNPGYFSAIATDTMGCKIEDSTFIGIFPKPSINTTPDTTICLNSSAKLLGYGNYTFIWNNTTNSSSITVNPSVKTRYNLLIENSFGCKDTTSIVVDLLPIPTAKIFCEKDTICRGKTIKLEGSGGDSYLWSTGETAQNIDVRPKGQTKYKLRVTNTVNSTKCSHDTTFELNVHRCNYFYVPTAFSPNGDGRNDFFAIGGKYEAVESYQIYIYNRWGQMVYSSNDPHSGWNGKFKGKTVQQGVYAYIIIIHEMFMEPYQLTGTLTLMR